jgi:methionyl-tRNA synthetase
MRFNRMLEIIWKLVMDANAYVDAQAPWNLKKTDEKRMETVLYVLAEVVRVLGISILSVTPEAGHKILDQLKIPENERNFSFINEDNMLKSGTAIDKPEGVFPRLETNEKAA